jgi:hypothetical protein
MIGFYVAMFFGGAFFVNGIPHLVSGLMGRKFPSPFASPPGKGESSALVNVLWAFFNFCIAYALLCYFFILDLHLVTEVAVAAIGGLAIGLHLAWHFGKVYENK